MHDHDYLRARLLACVVDTPVGGKAESLEELQRSEWSPEFERLMRNRLIVGRFRYGLMERDLDLNYDRVGSAIKRLGKYLQSGNLEHLVDVANLMLLEFTHSEHPMRHLQAADDAEHVTKI